MYRGNDETTAHPITELQPLKIISCVHYMKLKNTYDIMLCEKNRLTMEYKSLPQFNI